ncbi:MAG: DUF3891 family protein [Solirubrobacteraceae bacterium]
MLIRHDDQGVLAIGQPAHAWVCGQLARMWGNARFGAVAPLEEVALGAEQHDVGMAELDLDPQLDAATGLPRSFLDVALPVHLSLWRGGPPRLASQSRYAALLAAMHGRRLYEARNLSALAPEEADQIRDFIADSREFESSMLAALRDDPVAAPHAAPEIVARNSQLIWNWDLLSLSLLLGWEPRPLGAVPTADGGEVDVALEHVAGDDRSVSLDPWPFSAPVIHLRAEGRRLTENFSSPEALATGWARAPWETIEMALVPVPAR